MNLYTIGYEKRNIDEFINLLKAAKVEILIDVREIAWSYKKDFCKRRLSESLSNSGIEYIHLKSLGNPKEIRKSDSSQLQILKRYKEHLTKTGSGLLELLTVYEGAKIANRSICLTCFEREYHCCHRSIIADSLKSRLKNIKIYHI